MNARPATVSQLLPPAEIAPSVTLPSLAPRLRSKSNAGLRLSRLSNGPFSAILSGDGSPASPAASTPTDSASLPRSTGCLRPKVSCSSLAVSWPESPPPHPATAGNAEQEQRK